MDTKRNEKKLARRDFLTASGLVATGVGVSAVGLNAAMDVQAGENAQTQSWPWPYKELDVELVRKRGHACYYEGGCMYGASGGLLSVLRDEIGAPYSGFPHDMLRYGGGGIAGWGTVCGSLNGACAMITLAAGKAYGKITNELMAWYTTTPFPSEAANRYATKHEYLVEEYKADQALATTVSNSPLCHVSVNTWCRATGFASGSKQRAERCARLTGDVAAKAAELLNAHARGELVTGQFERNECNSCHFMGENFESGQFIIGKGNNCTDCHGSDPHGDMELPEST
ncbi:MAG: C-GCAxxG-C-C family protein [Lysobacterales bacterium]